MKKTGFNLICLPYFVKVGDDFIKQPQTFQAFLVDIALCVKLFEIWHWGEHHAHTVIGFVVKVLEKYNDMKMLWKQHSWPVKHNYLRQ